MHHFVSLKSAVGSMADYGGYKQYKTSLICTRLVLHCLLCSDMINVAATFVGCNKEQLLPLIWFCVRTVWKLVKCMEEWHSTVLITTWARGRFTNEWVDSKVARRVRMMFVLSIYRLYHAFRLQDWSIRVSGTTSEAAWMTQNLDVRCAEQASVAWSMPVMTNYGPRARCGPLRGSIRPEEKILK